jgi:hypothetical protein
MGAESKFDGYDLPPELRAPRVLNKARIPDLDDQCPEANTGSAVFSRRTEDGESFGFFYTGGLGIWRLIGRFGLWGFNAQD